MDPPNLLFWTTSDLLECLAVEVSFFPRSFADGLHVRLALEDGFHRVAASYSNLANLCRVNRPCNHVFTRALYNHTHFQLLYRAHQPLRTTQPALLMMARQLATNRNAVHIRTLTLDHAYSPCHRDLEAAFCRLIERAPALRAIRLFVDQLNPVFIAKAAGSASSHLSAVVCHSPTGNPRFGLLPPDYTLTQDFSLSRSGQLFPHLRTLAFLNIPLSASGPHEWIMPIVDMLHAAPDLHTLQLSVSFTTAGLQDYVMDSPDRTAFKTFLLRICTLYKATGAAPLRLRCFACGPGVHPNFPPGSDVTITDLIALDDLEEVYLNTGVGIPRRYRVPEAVTVTSADGEIPISTFLYDTPRLRRFTVSRYDDLVHSALVSPAFDPARARQLLVAWSRLSRSTTCAPRDLVRISASPRLHFRMLKIDVQGPVYAANHDGVIPSRAKFQALADAEEVLRGLVDGDDGTLEGLAIHLPRNPSNGDLVNFQDIGGQERFVDLLVRIVPRLTGLTQISMTHECRWVETEGHMFWDIAARRLAEAGQGLKYVITPGNFGAITPGDLCTIKRGERGEVTLDWTWDERLGEGVELERWWRLSCYVRGLSEEHD